MKIMNTRECLKDFFRRFGKANKELLEFCDVTSSSTEIAWRKHGIMPTGETLLRLRYFLDSIGYKVAELERAPKELFSVGQCVAFKVLTHRDVAREIETSDHKVLFRYFYEDKPLQITSQRLRLLQIVASNHEARLNDLVERKKAELKKLSVKNVDDDQGADNDDAESLVRRFAEACSNTRTLGQILLAGPVNFRTLMRQKMADGAEPLLHTTWHTLNQLLKERIQ